MQQLFIGLKTRFDSSSGATLRSLLGHDASVSPKFWLNEAPQDTKLPVLIVSMPAAGSISGSMSTSGIAHIEDALIQFSVFVDDYELDDGMLIFDEVRKLYDNYRFGFGTSSAKGHVMQVMRQTHGLVLKDPDGGYQITCDYAYKFDEVL